MYVSWRTSGQGPLSGETEIVQSVPWGGVTLLVKRYRQPLKAGKGQKESSLLELLEGIQFCQYLAFKAARPTLDF